MYLPLKKKNEARINATVASTLVGTENSYSVQGAYAVTNHFALAAAVNGTMRSQDELSYSDGSGNTGVDIIKYKRNSFEFGAGVFYPISRDKKVFFETYAGYGVGTNKITDLTNTTVNDFHNSNTNRFYIQPSFSFHTGPNFTLSTVLRFTSVGYTDIKTSYSNDDLQTYFLLDITRKRLLFVEPALVSSFGFESAPWFRIQAQMNATILTGASNTNYRSNYFSVGLQVDPIKAFRKK